MILSRGTLMAVTLVCAATLQGQVAHAQSIWMPPTTNSQIRLEVLKPMYDAEGVGFWTQAWYLSGQARLSPVVALQFEVPYSRYEEEGFETQSTVGNPYIGMVYGAKDLKGVIVEAGGRLPLLSEEDVDEDLAALINGWAADFTRMEAFAPETVTLRLRAGGHVVNNAESGVNLRLMLGAQAWIPTDDGETELVADADMGLWMLGTQANVGAVLSAKTLLTESDLSISERSEFQLGLSGSMRFGQVEPGIHARLPLANEGLIGLGEFVDAVVGVTCTVHLVP